MAHLQESAIISSSAEEHVVYQIANAPMREYPYAHLYIDNPLSGGGMRSLFSTHPPMEERIARLQAMAHEPGGGGIWAAPQAAPAPVRRGGSVPQTGSRGPWS